MEIHHIGIATDNAEASANRLTAVIDAEEVHAEEFDGMDIRYLDVNGEFLELIEPIDHDHLSRFIEREGPGLHHVGFETRDIERQLEVARDAGVELIDESPRPGAWGHEVAFLDPKGTAGVLIEYVSID